jgi:hypothetical protein
MVVTTTTLHDLVPCDLFLFPDMKIVGIKIWMEGNAVQDRWSWVQGYIYMTGLHQTTSHHSELFSIKRTN